MTSFFNLNEHFSRRDEATHMQLLRQYQILDSDPEQSFDDMTELVAYVTKCPAIAIVFFDVEKQRVWFKSSIGLNVKELPLDSDCHQQTECTFKEFSNHSDFPKPLDDWGIQYFATLPICCPGGYKLGNLVIFDYVPRELTQEQIQSVVRIGRQITKLIELRKTVNLLKAANKDKSHFMGMVSHDIRQPLANIMLSCELLSEQLRGNDGIEYLVQTAHSSAGLMHHLVDDLLQMVKMDLGKMEITLEKKPADLARIVAHVVNTNRILASKKNINIEFNILNWQEQGTCTPWEEVEARRKTYSQFYIDSLRIEQLMNNLISNAVKFSYPNSKVEVYGEKKDIEGTVEITIKDHGKGIPSSDMNQLFTAFSRLSVKPTAGEASNGLGLCIVKSIVEAHRGNIIVESTVGKGSIFKIVLPLKSTPTPIRKNSVVEINRFLTDPIDKKLRILLADDNTVNQHLVSQVLSKRGHDVILANDGVDALQTFERDGEHHGFDILLIDDEMPRMTGREVIQAIRRNEQVNGEGFHIPIISISGNVTEEFSQTIKKIGADHCVSKPFRLQNLIEAVENYTSYIKEIGHKKQSIRK
jgi:signal transduction histidine kinase/FixJ family two-component response regulator